MQKRKSKAFSLIHNLLFLLILVPAWGCLQTENSSSADSQYRGDTGGGEDPEFTAVKAIFSTSCVPCHLYGGYTEAQFETEGLVVPGDINTSPIYFNLIGSTAPTGDKDMPQAPEAPLTDAQMDAIRNWITTFP